MWFEVGSWVRQMPEEGWRTYQPKCWEYNNKDDNSLKTLNDKKIGIYVCIYVYIYVTA